MSRVEIRKTTTVSVLSESLRKEITDFKLRLAMRYAGYADPATGYPPMPSDWGVFPQAHVVRSRAFYGTEAFSYNHHQSLTKFKGRYVVSWSSGLRHEDHPGQEVHYSTSSNGLDWEKDRVLAHTDPDSRLVRHNHGLYATETHLYALVGVCDTRGNTQLGMCSMDAEKLWIDVYETDDLQNWKHHKRIAERVYSFEEPRATRSGRLLCFGAAVDDWSQGLVLLWEKRSNPTDTPRTIQIPKAEGLEPLQGSWYQTDDGRIWLFLRDGSFSCRLALTWSEDEGETWSKPLLTDFPNTSSRIYAGKLDDGRYYLSGNNYDRLLDRRHLLLALSENGETFDGMRTIVSGPTTRRIEGKHKEDGYHYPNCYVDKGKLFVTYSVNKEGIEVAEVDTTRL
jgi:hypothetical protein